MDRTLKLAIGSLTFNIAFATYYLAMGLVTNSWWLLTLGSYYLVLSLVRFMVLRSKSKERFIAKFTGWMLILLSIPLVGTVILSVALGIKCPKVKATPILSCSKFIWIKSCAFIFLRLCLTTRLIFDGKTL